jgi:PAS domain S-box-containing protein
VISVYSVGLYRRQAQVVRRSNVDLEASRERERQAGQQLREKVEELTLLGAVVDGSTFGVTIADARQPDFPIVYANPAFYAMTGLGPEQVIGRNCRFLKGPETDPAVSAALGAAVREGRPWTAEVLNYRADGQTFWNRLTLFPVGGTPGRPNHFVGYQIDITAVRAAQAEREQMMAEIQESQKLESLGVLVAGVAHEVNNPLGIALTAATHMAQSAQDMLADLRSHRLVDEDLADYLEDQRVAFDLIVSNLKRAADLVRSFKDVAADQADEHRREVQAAPFLSTLTTSLAPIVKRARCRLDLDVEGDFTMVVDTGAFAQLVTNLVVNATVHAFEGFSPDQPRSIRLSARQLPGTSEVEMSVQDDGVGIPAALADRIFEPFFTTRRGQGGTGLGLFVVHRIVTQNLGGSIRLEAVQPHGTRFVLRFPQRHHKEPSA